MSAMRRLVANPQLLVGRKLEIVSDIVTDGQRIHRAFESASDFRDRLVSAHGIFLVDRVGGGIAHGSMAGLGSVKHGVGMRIEDLLQQASVRDLEVAARSASAPMR